MYLDMKQFSKLLFLMSFLSMPAYAQQILSDLEANRSNQLVENKDPGIEVSNTKYSVFKTQSCTEKQDAYYNYLGTYECKPVKTATIQINIQIHLNEPMYDEALITITEPVKNKKEQFPIEYVELLEDGVKVFHFSISNQPHVFLLNEVSKTITWESEWGHWKEVYFYK